jgi:hypothetical protein
MEVKKFKQLLKIYTKLPLPREVSETEEYAKYINALHNDKECSELYKRYYIKEAGLNYKKYCCTDMAYQLVEDSKPLAEDEINYDAVMRYCKSHKEFGIPIHDGGASYISINYCPWCGTKLKK